ncbi:sulfur transferase domain-containing protein [Luteimonas sp. M1R5S18]|uniref:Sulfur transferase domain-containing protein n=1 Tax=Luteimonas rhizosphaericola TaxID=3042024 RepID=A0ABT6JMS2_9GAMM|nr:sulfur transferase domain-containing protein [Luteimonas rhizosphaericola]MDH5831985.1 sulfur transferase domain-containing protein [Luteimonas rhizosphaericola]
MRGRIVRHRVGCALGLLAAALLAGGAASAHEPAEVSRLSMASGPAVPGLRTPRPGLLTAGQPDAAAWRALADEGVVAVINLRPGTEVPNRDLAAEVGEAGLAYHAIPVAGADGLTDANADRLWRLVHDAPGTVLVHCATANRAGALLALGAARAGGMSPADALAFGRAAGLASPALEARVRERLGLPADAQAD